MPVASGNGQTRSAQISWAEVEIAGTSDPGFNVSYSYDHLNRLTGVAGTSGARSYSYDPVGNRLTSVAGSTTNYAYDRADRITAAGASSTTVNAAGAMTNKGSSTYAYDQANRLTTATVGGASEAYTYDGDGVRFNTQVNAVLSRLVTDVAAPLPVTLTDGIRKYVWGVGLAYAASASGIEVYQLDRLGSVRAITDASGSIVATYRTDEFGNPTATTGSSTQPYRFSGEPRDGTGLIYLRARYYDPSIGRFMSRDYFAGSLARCQTLNRYSYALNNPATLVDPSGLTPNGPNGFVPYDQQRIPNWVPLIGGCRAQQWGSGFGDVLQGTIFEIAATAFEVGSVGSATPVTLAIAIAGTFDIYEGLSRIDEACDRAPAYPLVY
jgi:RHS repeat-associated protein